MKDGERPAAELVDARRTGAEPSIVDVRTVPELNARAVPGALHVELSEVRHRVDEIAALPGPVWLLCRSGRRAHEARQTLAGAGLGECVVVAGGIGAYEQAGGDVLVGEGGMSLERQVRIAAGSLVAVGVLGSWFVHPWMLGLSLFVGCGLVFAGITDTCGMGLMLARAPWNRTRR